MKMPVHIGSLMSYSMARMASDTTTGTREPPPKGKSLAERRDELLVRSDHRKALTAFRSVRKRAGAVRSGPCVGCPCRRRCTAPCAEFDRFV